MGREFTIYLHRSAPGGGSTEWLYNILGLTGCVLVERFRPARDGEMGVKTGQENVKMTYNGP